MERQGGEFALSQQGAWSSSPTERQVDRRRAARERVAINLRRVCTRLTCWLRGGGGGGGGEGQLAHSAAAAAAAPARTRAVRTTAPRTLPARTRTTHRCAPPAPPASGRPKRSHGSDRPGRRGRLRAAAAVRPARARRRGRRPWQSSIQHSRRPRVRRRLMDARGAYRLPPDFALFHPSNSTAGATVPLAVSRPIWGPLPRCAPVKARQ